MGKNVKNTKLDLFDRCVASVFTELIKNFPVPALLDFNELSIDLWDEEGGEEEHFNNLEVYANTVAWLRRAGYVWADDVGDWEARQVVLSPQGLELLKMPISLKQPGSSFGEEIGKALKTGARDKAARLVSDALTAGIKLITTL